MRTTLTAFMLTAALFVPATLPALAKDVSYIGTVHVVRGAGDGADRARGTVFLDANRNSEFDAGETGIAGVSVSNGREVAVTGADGRYELPAYGDMNLFVTKPSGYAVPLSQQMVPQFSYVHKEAGSPPLRFGGIEPTGPLPLAINFPLVEDNVGDTFQAMAFGDAQAYSNREIGYVRDTVGRMLATRDTSDVEFLIFEGDIMGDDLSLYDRFKDIIATGGIPQYFVAGNHDLDFDAAVDTDSFDTFRREWGPEYYSFTIGKVHIVVLDNVRYPCNGIDPHPFCARDASLTYNGVVTGRQLTWLANDLAEVPQDHLILLNAHIPFQSFTDAHDAKSQTDNFAALVAILGDRPALGLSGHTHTVEQILPGESFEGWMPNTGVGVAPFHQIVTGGVSASWWAGDLNDQGIPHGTQRLGSPRGFYLLDFDGPNYTDTYLAFGMDDHDQLHASFNTPRFREWADKLFAFADAHPIPADVIPPVIRTDLGDMNMLTRADLAGGSWVAVNVWNGSKDAEVSVSINGGDPIVAERTQPGTGEAMLKGAEYADPLALAKQATQGRMAWRSAEGGDQTAGYQTWKGVEWQGQPGPFMPWMLSRMSNHLWRADLPPDLPNGVHTLTAKTIDRHGRSFSHSLSFEVVDEVPELNWDAGQFVQ